jgi:hypothetical protein
MIKGLTDTLALRRDGKIRAGGKDEKGYPKNYPHFLLHDAPQLIPILTETPTEIFFTIYSDDLRHAFQPDLRWYSKTELICKSMHDYVNPKTQTPMGSVAAFFKVGQEVSGLSQEQFPGVARSRVRQCSYKSCPDYINANCTEHMFLNIMVPQYSMGSLFTLDNTSINAVKNTLSCFQKAALRYQGKISGQIYRMFKKKDTINFPNKDGSMSKRPTDVVHIENVSFAEYETQFRSAIAPEDWDALMYIRSRELYRPANPTPIIGSEGQDELLEAAQQAPQLETSLTNAAAQTDDDAVRRRANDAAAAPAFAEIAQIVGKENSEELRMATAKAFPDVQSLVTYLKNRIKDSKKAKKDVKPTSVKDVAAAAPQAPPAAPAVATAPAEHPLF